MNKDEREVHNTLKAINNAWRNGNPEEMKIHLHPEIVMKFPGFSGEISCRETLVNSFIEFCTNAKVIEYAESDEQINIIGNCAITSFQFDMVFERAKSRYKSTGRDVWVFERIGNNWLAVWRTMIDISEDKVLE